jgi:hypothetical protein
VELAESRHGKELYGLHDNGFLLAEEQSRMTPIQRFVYVLAKDHHTDDSYKDPSGFQQSQAVRQATNQFK